MAYKRKSNAAEAWHRFHTYNDPDFRSDILALPKRKIPDSFKDYDRLAEKYDIDAVYVDFVHERDWSDFDPNEEIGGNIVHQNPEKPGFIAYLNPNITKKQILKVFSEIQMLKKELQVPATKYKAPTDSELLYAIYKANKNGQSFNTIFIKYQAGSLPLYTDKPTNQYASEDELEKYFRKHYIKKV